MTKDTATIREVYQAISDMRREMQDMKHELKDEFKTSMDAHCKWAQATVENYDQIAKDYEKRIKTQEEFVANITGKMAVIGGIVILATNLFVDFVKDALTKGR